jgi:hypothetical protein
MKTEDHVARLKEKLALASRGIRAPFDGVITALDPRMRPGFQPGEGMVIGEMESPHAMEAQALIPEEDLRRASVGREVKLRLPGAESEARAVISGVRSYSERSLSGSPFSGKIGGSIAVEPKENDEDAPLNAFYTCVADVSAAGIPSGMTGKMVIADPPLSIAARFTREMRKTLRRESLM